MTNAYFNEYPSLTEEDIEKLLENVRERQREYEGENSMFRLMMQKSNMLRSYADDGKSEYPRAKIFAERMEKQNSEIEEKISNYNRYISLNAWRDFELNISGYINKYLECREERLNEDSPLSWNDSLPWYPPYPQTSEEFVELYVLHIVRWFGNRPENVSDVAIHQMELLNPRFRNGEIDGVSVYGYFGLL